MKCKIQWVDQDGRKTADDAEAIGYVFRQAYTSIEGWKFPETEAYPICEEHAKRLARPDMRYWVLHRHVRKEAGA